MSIPSIQSVRTNTRPPTLGKIRLGERKESSSGSQYPVTVEHFVLKDAPEVESVYGPDPKSIDVVFPSDDLDRIIPFHYRLYSGAVKGRDGKILGGDLRCMGNGPDEHGNPGVAMHREKRQPDGTIPERPCWGEKCPDFYNTSGVQQCKQRMIVSVILPLVSCGGIFEISTTSWASIRAFYNKLAWVKNINGDIPNMAFKIVRREVATKFRDPKTGAEKTGKQFIMLLEDNPGFWEKHGDQIRSRAVSLLGHGSRFSLPTTTDRLVSGDSLGYIEEGSDLGPVIDAPKPLPQGLSASESLMSDSDISAAFDSLEAVTGKKFDAKARLISIRKYEGSASQKSDVLGKIGEMVAKSQKSAPKSPEPVHAKTPSAPVMDAPAAQPVAQQAPAKAVAQQAPSSEDEGIM